MSEDPRIEAVADLLAIKYCFPQWGSPSERDQYVEDAKEILAAADAAAWRQDNGGGRHREALRRVSESPVVWNDKPKGASDE